MDESAVKETVIRSLEDVLEKKIPSIEECNLINEGLDSFKLLNLLVLLEEELNFEFEDHDLAPENFTTLAAFMNMLSKYNVDTS
ncbi:phosphopantetheine-binding protein [Paenibacillus lutrae]|uniref:Carrier domain-containing protein n=1 Tax=Paenibacillus lutrae TaxID=2078573 RepID=A0A7X3FFW0_9BACL|nr:phosphopantetheine-binding protein [Paenibacillus lutrae]MVO98636.1 hypothetical protein [Paenibacillus lutrae]